MLRRPDDVTGFGEARIWSETTRLDLRLSEVANPRPGDRIEIDGEGPSSSRASPSATASGSSGPWTCARPDRDEAEARHHPDLVAAMAAEVKAGEKAVTAAMREAGTGLKTAWRGQITGAGLGRRLANSIRSQTYPKAGESLNAAALVWSKAPVIVGAHDTGPLIRSKDGFWLAIPTEAAGRGLRGGKITPGEWERRRGLRLRFVYRRRMGRACWWRRDGSTAGGSASRHAPRPAAGVTVPIFLLVPQVKLPKRLDLAGCRAGARQRAGADRGELGGGAAWVSA
jgi:hypothetical protein